MSFYTFTLPKERCVQLLLKKLGRGMPESVVLKDLEALDIHVQAVMQLRKGRRHQDPTKKLPLTNTSLFQWRGGPRSLKYDLSLNSAVCECRWSPTWPQSVPGNATFASASDTRRVTAYTRPGASSVVVPTSTEVAQPRGKSLSAESAGAPHRELQGLY